MRNVPDDDAFWSATEDSLFARLGTRAAGLSGEDAARCLTQFGTNRLGPESRAAPLALLLGQFKSPIILILIAAAILSAFLRDATDAAIILAIVIASGLLGFWQEHGAANAVAKLRAIVETKARAPRNGIEKTVPVEEIVPGDVALISAGVIIPGDSGSWKRAHLFVNEATLTGETYPVEKMPGILPADTALARWINTLFMGTHVISGSGRALVVRTGRATEFGKIFASLKLRPPETEFEHGIRHFGYLLAEVTLLLVIAIFAFNVYFHKSVFESFLFALALAVGLTPQLLPAIISVNLSHGARRMAEKKVIVKRLASIENFGSMNVLCSDKTGTITEGYVRVHAALDAQGRESAKALLYAWLNATIETGFVNPIDTAIRACAAPDGAGWRKLDELPYDFVRKRLSILFEKDSRHVLITKGALRQMLGCCARVEMHDGSVVPLEDARPGIERLWNEFSEQGRRVLGVAYREGGVETHVARDGESGMIFLGFIVLSDPPKTGLGSMFPHELQQAHS